MPLRALTAEAGKNQGAATPKGRDIEGWLWLSWSGQRQGPLLGRRESLPKDSPR